MTAVFSLPRTSLLADVLAEMAVWQTREWFMKEHGFIVDNP